MRCYFQLHLLTMVLLTLGAGLLLGLNVRGYHQRQILIQTQTHNVQRLGGRHPAKTDKRVVVATHSFVLIDVPVVGWPIRIYKQPKGEILFFREVPDSFHVSSKELEYPVEYSITTFSELRSEYEVNRQFPQVASRIYAPAERWVLPRDEMIFDPAAILWNAVFCGLLLLVVAAALEWLLRRSAIPSSRAKILPA